MPDVWELEPVNKYNLTKVSDRIDNDGYSDIKMDFRPEFDIFTPHNMLFVIVSERLKKSLKQII